MTDWPPVAPAREARRPVRGSRWSWYVALGLACYLGYMHSLFWVERQQLWGPWQRQFERELGVLQKERAAALSAWGAAAYAAQQNLQIAQPHHTPQAVPRWLRPAAYHPPLCPSCATVGGREHGAQSP